MNRNFLKISVSIVALLLALVVCMSGCKVNDVAADLSSYKDDVAADQKDIETDLKDLNDKVDTNKSEVDTQIGDLGNKVDENDAAINEALKTEIANIQKALSDAQIALDAKINANSTSISVEVAALTSAIDAAEKLLSKADADLKAELNAAIAAAQAALNAAIEAVKGDVEQVAADLAAAKAALEAAIANNNAKIDAEVATLNAAILTAKEAAVAADEALKAELNAAIAAAQATLNAAIDGVKADLADAVAKLNAKIDANDANCAAEIAALNAALEAAVNAEAIANADLKAALEQTIAEASVALNGAIDNLKAELNRTIAALSGKTDENFADVRSAIAAAEAAAAAADGELKAALDKAVADADAALAKAVSDLKEELTNKINSIEEAFKGEDVSIKDTIADIREDITNMDGNVAGQIADINAQIADLFATIAEYKNTTEVVVAAWHEIYVTYQLWEACKGSYGNMYVIDAEGNMVDVDIEREYASTQVRLYRALTVAEVTAIKDAFFATIENVRSNELDNLNRINGYLDAVIEELAKETPDLAVIRANLDMAKNGEAFVPGAGTYKPGLDAIAAKGLEANLIIDGVVVNLNDKYDELWDAYYDARIEYVLSYIAQAEMNRADARDVDALAAVWENLDIARAEILAIIADGEYADELVAEYNTVRLYTVKTLARFVSVMVADSNNIDDINAAEVYVELVADAIDELAADAEIVVDINVAVEGTTLAEDYTALKQATIDELLGYAEAKIAEGDIDGEYGAVKNLFEARIRIVDLGADVAKYNELRVAVVAYINAGIDADLDAVADLAGLDAVNADLDELRALIADLAADTLIPVDTANVVAAYNATRANVVYKMIAFAAADLDAAADVTALDNVKKALAAIDTVIADYAADAEFVIDTTALTDAINVVKADLVIAFFDLAQAGIDAADDLLDLLDDKAIIDNTRTYIDTITADVTELIAAYDEVLAAYYAKYVDIYAAELTARMNAYIDNLAAIYDDVANGGADIADIRADYVAFVDNRDYMAALHGDSEIVAALVEAETAFCAVEDQYLTLAAIVADADAVATILDSAEFTTIEGVKAEFEVIKAYRAASATWVERLDALYAEFTAEANAEAYAEIRELIDEAAFDAINTEFEAQIAHLITAADDVTAAMEALQAAVEGGYKFETAADIAAAKVARNTWIGLATDPDGVAFVLDWRSEGALTHEMLITTVNSIDTAYKAWLATAQADWAACYTDHVQDLFAGTENLIYSETALKAVRAWFDVYGVITADYAAANDLTDVGTAVEEAKLTELEAKLVELIAEREALIADLAAQAVALQDRINNLGTITTDSKNTVTTLRADYDKWVKACANNNVEQNAENGTVVDPAALVAAEAKLAELETLKNEIIADIAALAVPTLGDDASAPYFANVGEKDTYAAAVVAIQTKLADFKTLNDGDYRGCFTSAQLKKVDDCALVAVKYEALVKVYNAYVAIDAQTSDATIKAELKNYIADARVEVNKIDSATANAAAVIGFYGNQAEADMMEIAGL
ncbi:MAG: hypothetical protein E7667_03770 [Ruminococcaceae bacterium]|nr:hypothetical protein [Oscillospiraceae bacterium]